MWIRSLGWEDLLEKEMASHSSILAWKIPWTEEPGELQPMGSQRVGHNWATGVLRFMGLQRVGHDWVTELSWVTKDSSLSSRICKCGIQGCCPTSSVSLFHYEDFFELLEDKGQILLSWQHQASSELGTKQELSKWMSEWTNIIRPQTGFHNIFLGMIQKDFNPFSADWPLTIWSYFVLIN